MTRVIEFFGDLKKSTKITLLSCGCFVLMTFVILLFFIWFPITPSEKIISNIGRENIFRDQDGNPTVVTASPEVVTTSSTGEASSTKASSTKTTATGTRTSFKIVITSGSGFLWNGRIPTGVMPGNYETETTAVDPNTIPDPGYPEPTYPGGETQYPTVPYDPNAGQDPSVTPDPGVVEDPPVTPDPPIDSGGGTDLGVG